MDKSEIERIKSGVGRALAKGQDNQILMDLEVSILEVERLSLQLEEIKKAFSEIAFRTLTASTLPYLTRHISEIAEARIRAVRDELKEGDQILVKVLGIEGNKIRLSRKAVLRDQKDRPAAAKMVAKFLKMPLELATELMPKVEFDMDWQPRSLESIQVAVKQLEDQKKLKGTFDYANYIYVDLVKAVRPGNVKITDLPK